MIEIDEPSAEVLQRDVTIDGTEYLLTARRLASGWFGEWICRRCGKRGVNGVVYSTPTAALDATAKNLGPHDCRPPK